MCDLFSAFVLVENFGNCSRLRGLGCPSESSLLLLGLYATKKLAKLEHFGVQVLQSLPLPR
jgi:hypothetical protein